jgi:hypothetical protein
MLVGLLSRDGGATVAEMAAALGWQQHTIRGVMSGALAKKFGFQILSGVVGGRGRVYRTEGATEMADDAEGARE